MPDRSPGRSGAPRFGPAPSWHLAALCALLAWSAPGVEASAQSAGAPASAAAAPKSELEKYEDAYLEERIRRNGLQREPNPEGKLIEDIIVEVEEVFDPRDVGLIGKVPIIGLAPKVANKLHARTRRYVVARELLFSVGRPYREAIAKETERNLRALVILAIARIAACKGSQPNTVRVLVATKDLWSLRFETDFQASGGRLDYLRLNVVERNLAGRNMILSGTMGITRDEISVGQTFYDPRLFGTRIFLDQSASMIFGRGERGLEGGTGHLQVGQPLYSLASKWGWDAAADFSINVSRFFRGADFFRCFEGATPTGGIRCDNDLRGGDRTALLDPRSGLSNVTPVFLSKLVTFAAGGIRRFGEAIKHDLSFGYGLRHAAYDLIGDFPSEDFREQVRGRFLPRSENASFVYAGYRTFDTRFATLRNVNVFALTEDYQYGHDLRFVSRWANKVFGIDQTYLELDGSAQYRWLFGGEDLLTVYARAQTRLAGSNAVNNRFTFLIRNLSPILGIGRLIFEAAAIFRFDDQDNIRSTLGGNTGLRGYETDIFRGRHWVNMHLEYRSLPFDLLTVQVGFVAFVDSGHAADRLSDLKLRHSIGAGLRIFLPQINRQVLRIDYGVPLSDGGPSGAGQQLSFSFDQAF